MKKEAGFLLLLCAAIILNTTVARPNEDVPSGGSGNPCAICTILVGTLEGVSTTQYIPIETLMEDACSYLPEVLREPCDELVKVYGQDIIKYVTMHDTADVICLKLRLCSDATCHLYPRAADWKPDFEIQPVQLPRLQSSLSPRLSPWDLLKELINRVFNIHEPLVDVDNDKFSTIEVLRGTHWRGRDCDDLDRNVHPGRNEFGSPDPKRDMNCNGISGISPTGVPYEELLCGQSQPRGIAILGDSASAHFHIDPNYVNASAIHKGTYAELIPALEDEFDLPYLSSTTGFYPSSPTVPVDSMYLRMRERNRCNHRDYQNISVNGARSGAMEETIMYSLARNHTDLPLLLFYSLIGNDVCHPSHSLEAMTTPEQFYQHVTEAMTYVDSILPPNSHVVFVGLADGRVLWDSMHNRTHPAGIQYADMYAWLNCLNISPCWVWLNENETVRDLGSQRAAELSAVYKQVMANNTYKNFDMAYYDFPFVEVIAKWQAQGGQIWQLIEPVDGFHPNQIAQALSTQVIWDHMESEHPTFLGPVNPNNEMIQQLFGDQGGY